MLITFIRAILLYLLIIFSMRIMGKRQIGELQPGELAVAMMISDIAVLPIEDTNIPMLVGAVPILALVCFEIILSNIGMKNKKFRKFLEGNPITVIRNGEIDQKALHKLRFTIDDLMESLRGKDVFDVSEVDMAIVETNGTLNVFKKFDSQSLTPKMVGLSGNTTSPPLVMISDGRMVSENMKMYGITAGWIHSKLKKENLRIEEVFIMTIDADKKIFFAKKDASL